VTALILTYHAIDDGPPAVCVDPKTFRAHLDAIARTGAEVLTVSELVEALGRDDPPERAVAITFDDGFRSVVREAAPMLHARGMPATVFAVAGHLGRENDWPSRLPDTPRRALADAEALAALVDEGWEIGSHGYAHAPLGAADDALLERELVASRRSLETVVDTPVTSFAYPYGVLPDAAGLEAVRGAYATACTAELRTVSSKADPVALPRVEVQYVRRPELIERALHGYLDAYLWTRGLGARVRRMVRRDYATGER
jgi:peptidoglycan/xylan/chitin deacetylase (PgdA/CDA1 family)